MALAALGLNAAWGPSVLDAKDVRFFEIAERWSGDSHFVHLDGLVFHSSLAVQRVDITREDDAAVVTVHLLPAAKGLSGSFAVDVPLEASVHRILFGPTRREIWPHLQSAS